jgi:hypothetical protein
MIREHLFHKRAPADAMLRWRGAEILRLEGLSAGVSAVTWRLIIGESDEFMFVLPPGVGVAAEKIQNRMAASA